MWLLLGVICFLTLPGPRKGRRHPLEVRSADWKPKPPPPAGSLPAEPGKVCPAGMSRGDTNRAKSGLRQPVACAAPPEVCLRERWLSSAGMGWPCLHWGQGPTGASS